MAFTKLEILDQLRDLAGTAGSMLIVKEVHGNRGMTTGNWEMLRGAVRRARDMIEKIDGPLQAFAAPTKKGK